MNHWIHFKKSICTLTLFPGHRHIMTPKQTLSEPHWIGKSSFYSGAQSSLAVNLIFKRIHLHLIPQMESHGLRSHHISIPNPKWQKNTGKQDQSCFANFTSKLVPRTPCREFQYVFNSNRCDNWKLLTISISTDRFHYFGLSSMVERQYRNLKSFQWQNYDKFLEWGLGDYLLQHFFFFKPG